MVHNAQFWLMIVHEYLDDKTPMSKLCKKYSVDAGKIKYRANLFLRWGNKPFTDEQENRVYSREEKLKAIHLVIMKRHTSDAF